VNNPELIQRRNFGKKTLPLNSLSPQKEEIPIVIGKQSGIKSLQPHLPNFRHLQTLCPKPIPSTQPFGPSPKNNQEFGTLLPPNPSL